MALIATVEQVLEEFPEANNELIYPALSIITQGTPEFSPELSPYLLEEIEEPEVGEHKAPAKYVVGSYDLTLQVDIWCGSKEERFTAYDQFFAALNKQFQPMGLSLQLVDYHNVWARYDLSGHTFDDSAAGSQRNEWRVKCNVLVHCRAVVEREEFIVTQPIETELETPNNIENEE
jgi:hypothetical protein